MIRSLAWAVLAGLVAVACAAPAYSVRSQGSTTRCLGQPGRGQNYEESRPLFFIFCAESP